MWPAPPHFVQTVVFVMLRGSVLCHGRKILREERKKKKKNTRWWASNIYNIYSPAAQEICIKSLTCYHPLSECHWVVPAPSAASFSGRSGLQGSQCPAWGYYESVDKKKALNFYNVSRVWQTLIFIKGFSDARINSENLFWLPSRDASIRYSVSVPAPIRSSSDGSGIGQMRPIQIRYCAYTIRCYC